MWFLCRPSCLARAPLCHERQVGEEAAALPGVPHFDARVVGARGEHAPRGMRAQRPRLAVVPVQDDLVLVCRVDVDDLVGLGADEQVALGFVDSQGARLQRVDGERVVGVALEGFAVKGPRLVVAGGQQPLRGGVPVQIAYALGVHGEHFLDAVAALRAHDVVAAGQEGDAAKGLFALAVDLAQVLDRLTRSIVAATAS